MVIAGLVLAGGESRRMGHDKALITLGDKPAYMYMADLLTVQANLAGNPAISIPAGTTQAGLPMGVQLMTGLLEENSLFDLSKLLEETLG